MYDNRMNMDFTDIHSHIIYRVDDGAGSPEESHSMLRIACKDGIRKMILTPHFKAHRHGLDPEVIERKAGALRTFLVDEGLDIELYTGCELLYFTEAGEYLANGSIPTMAGSRYVLTEFSPGADFSFLKSGLYEILSRGYMPILAHVERYECMVLHPEHAKEVRDMGALLQSNCGSILGHAGREEKRFTGKLLREELLDFAATDAHDTKRRAPKMSKAYGYIKRHYGETYAARLFRDNPEKILRDETI